MAQICLLLLCRLSSMMITSDKSWLLYAKMHMNNVHNIHKEKFNEIYCQRHPFERAYNENLHKCIENITFFDWYALFFNRACITVHCACRRSKRKRERKREKWRATKKTVGPEIEHHRDSANVALYTTVPLALTQRPYVPCFVIVHTALHCHKHRARENDTHAHRTHTHINHLSIQMRDTNSRVSP